MAAPSNTTEDSLTKYEEMFKDRFTEKDTEYMETVNTPLPDPPCVTNWFTKPRRDFNRGGYRGRGRGWRGRDGNRGGYHGNGNYGGRELGQGFDRPNYRDSHDHRGHTRDRCDRYHPYGDRGHRGQGHHQGQGRYQRHHDSNR